MIPNKIPKVYYSLPEAGIELGISRWKVERIVTEMQRRGMIKLSRNRKGQIRITARQLDRLKDKAKNYRSII